MSNTIEDTEAEVRQFVATLLGSDELRLGRVKAGAEWEEVKAFWIATLCASSIPGPHCVIAVHTNRRKLCVAGVEGRVVEAKWDDQMIDLDFLVHAPILTRDDCEPTELGNSVDLCKVDFVNWYCFGSYSFLGAKRCSKSPIFRGLVKFLERCGLYVS